MQKYNKMFWGNLKQLFSNKKVTSSLLIIDGDNISSNYLRDFLFEHKQHTKFDVEIYSIDSNVKRWRNSDIIEFKIANFYPVDNTPEAADIKIMIRMINLLSEEILPYDNVYLCSNDTGYETALYHFGRAIPVTVLSSNDVLLNISNTESIQIDDNKLADKTFVHSLLSLSMSLPDVGTILRAHGIKYTKLSGYLESNGFMIENNRISMLPSHN